MGGFIADTGDQRLIRQSTAAIAARYGHAYYAERARAGGHIAELWADLGRAGLLGVHLPAEQGGGGAGLTELVIITEELAANGRPPRRSRTCGTWVTASRSTPTAAPPPVPRPPSWWRRR